MEAQDLRLGNWVQYKAHDGTMQSIKVDSINIDGISLYGEECFLDSTEQVIVTAELRDNEIEGIRLTPEILLKAGFENRYGNEYFFMKLKFSYEINELSQFVRFHYSGKVTYLQYVHELQNLVYAVTKTELTINL